MNTPQVPIEAKIPVEAQMPVEDFEENAINSEGIEVASQSEDTQVSASIDLQEISNPIKFIDGLKKIYSYLDVIETLLGLTTISVSFVKWLIEMMEGERKSVDYINLIACEDAWSHYQLADKLNKLADASTLADESTFDDDNAKQILISLGYKWDNKKHLYCKTKETEQILKIFGYNWNEKKFNYYKTNKIGMAKGITFGGEVRKK